MKKSKFKTNKPRKCLCVILSLSLTVFCALFLCACGTPAASSSNSSTKTFVDDAGRTVQIPSNIEMVVPSGATTQQVLLTLCPDKMASLSEPLTDAEKKYIKSDSLSKLSVTGSAYGGKGSLNKESVAALGDSSKMVLVDVGEKKNSIKADLDKLQESLGICCIFIEGNLESYDKAYEKLGKALNCEERAKELSAYCNTNLEIVKEKCSSLKKSTIACITGVEGVNALAKGSYQSGVVDLVGDNIVVVDNASSKGAGNPIDLEQLANWDPEYLIFQSADGYKNAKVSKEWQGLKAVKNGSLYAIPNIVYCWVSMPASVNQVLGIQWLSRLMYPKNFDDTVEECVKGYFKTMYAYELTDSEVTELLINSK